MTDKPEAETLPRPKPRKDHRTESQRLIELVQEEMKDDQDDKPR